MAIEALKPEIGPLLKLACVISGTDPDLLRQTNSSDRNLVGGTSIMLMCVFGLQLTLWTVLLRDIATPLLLLPLAALIATAVFMLDRHLHMADWALGGELASAQRELGVIFKLIARVAVAVMLSLATATGVSLVLFAPPIDNVNKQTAARANEELAALYERRRAEIETRLLDHILSEIEALKGEQKRLQAVMVTRESLVTDARDAASKAQLEAARQQGGGLAGYRRGAGPLFREATRQQQVAGELATQAQRDAAALQQRYDSIGKSLEASGERLRAAQTTLRSHEADLQAAMLDDPRYVQPGNDLLSRMHGLDSLRRDPVMGETVQKIDALTKVTLVALELVFLVTKLFKSGSVYTVLLKTQTREQAARAVRAHMIALRRIREGCLEDGSSSTPVVAPMQPQMSAAPTTQHRSGTRFSAPRVHDHERLSS